LGFWIKKPDETISHKECSAGERKIIKSFSTLLNKEFMPSVVCIDNAEMHVEAGRHINLIESMKRCFPDSQIFASTHSYQISRNFGNKSQLYDMRLLKATKIVKEEAWRLYIIDEIKDSVSKLNSITKNKGAITKCIDNSNKLIEKILVCEDKDAIIEESCAILKNNLELYVNDIVLNEKERGLALYPLA
jgi:predicted ATP-binding protein involved in virulence